MRRMMFLFMLVVASVLSACSDSDSNPSLSFGKDIYLLNGDAPLEVVLNASEAVKSQTTVKFNVSGTAEEGEEYTLSATEFVFASGESSAKITVTPKNNFEEGRTIKLSLVAVSGYDIKGTGSTTITVVPQEAIIATFTRGETELTNTRPVTVRFRGATNPAYVSSKELHIPFEIGGTAVLGTHYEIDGNVQEFVIPAGKQEATITLKFKGAVDPEKDMIKLTIDESAGIHLGSNGSIAIQIVGPTSFANMVGRWQYANEFPSWENWIEGIVLDEYPGDEVGAPTATSSAGNLEFVSGEIDSMIVNMTGDLTKYLRNCKVTFVEELNDELVEIDDRALVQYMMLSNANVYFSQTQVNEREALIGFRFLNPERTQLQIRIIDYEPKDFFAKVWEDFNDPDEEFPMKEFFPLVFNFTKM